MANVFTSRNPRYGWIPDFPDHRDWQYQKLVPSVGALPSGVDLREHCPSVIDQGQLGCCTACALTGNLGYLDPQVFSRLFLYYNERSLRGTTNVDSGASLRDGIKTLVKAGDCLESLWPYDIATFTKQPNLAAYTDGANHQITSYYHLVTGNEMKHTLSTGFPFVFGFTVYESFESPAVAAGGMVPMPASSERALGGHAVMAVGYNDARSVWIVRNSWGSAWGDRGYFYMPYSYLADTHLASDFWTVRRMEM